MIFLVQKVNLVVEFSDDLLVLVLIVLHAQLIVVLTTLVELTKPQDLDVALLNAVFEQLDLGF